MKQKIGIWGFGVVGKSIANYIIDNNIDCDLQVLDKTIQNTDVKYLNINFISESEANISEFILNNDKIYVSPGIDISFYKQKYQISLEKICSELDIFANHWHKPIIAVTGSLGKTSTVTLLSDLIELSGNKVAMGGNIGTGMLDLLYNQESSDYAVLELSSFQLDLINAKTNFKPDIAIITNLYPNHLDRHKTLEEYFLAKYKIVAYQNSNQAAIVNWDLREYFIKLDLNRSIVFFGIDLNLQEIQKHISLRPQDIIYNLDISKCHVTKYTVSDIFISDIAINSFSYPINWLILHIVQEIIKLDFDFYNKNLKIPEHRLEYLGVYDNCKIYNDSKSTVPEATLAALDYCVSNSNGSEINLFIGGTSKGVNRQEFIKSIKVSNYKAQIKLFCFGLSDAENLHNWALEENLPSKYFDSLDLCIQDFYEYNKIDNKDKILLFSPSGASYDLFKDYIDRGRNFKKLVAKYFGH